MLVRKFEARSIKEAIELVKSELGPEAIILAAKENDKNYGLGGESSVEVTAAIQEQKYREKMAAERKLSTRDKDTFSRSSAKNQKKFIEVANVAKVEEPVRRPRTEVPYIDISEDGTTVAAAATPARAPAPPAPAEVRRLQDEIFRLREVVSHFQKIPQGFVAQATDLQFMQDKLVGAGLDGRYLKDLFHQAEEAIPSAQKKKRAFVEGWFIRRFLDDVQVLAKPEGGRYHCFVGSTGQGKTSTIVKFAAHLVLRRKKKVAVLSSDAVKVGAADQLKTYCQILNVPFGQIEGEVDWQALDQKLAEFDHVLIDTAGVNLRHPKDIDTVKLGIPSGISHKPQIHFVQSIMVRDRDAFEIADRFKLFDFSDVIFTRLDEAVQHGLIYNFCKRYGCAVMAFGTGSSVPDAFEFATKERIVDLIFQLSTHSLAATNERGMS
jgi:flagellar biosynthesis protein FlhF